MRVRHAPYCRKERPIGPDRVCCDIGIQESQGVTAGRIVGTAFNPLGLNFRLRSSISGIPRWPSCVPDWYWRWRHTDRTDPLLVHHLCREWDQRPFVFDGTFSFECSYLVWQTGGRADGEQSFAGGEFRIRIGFSRHRRICYPRCPSRIQQHRRQFDRRSHSRCRRR